jgi:hypothetical protein
MVVCKFFYAYYIIRSVITFSSDLSFPYSIKYAKELNYILVLDKKAIHQF